MTPKWKDLDTQAGWIYGLINMIGICRCVVSRKMNVNVVDSPLLRRLSMLKM